MIPFVILAIESPDDRDFMADLYESYRRLMYSEINKIVKDHWATEDVIQITLERLIDKVELLRSLDKPRLINYVSSASRNTALNYVRREKRVSPGMSFDEAYGTEEQQPYALSEELLLKEMMSDVNSAWKTLDDKSRRVLEMKYILELEDADIAAELGIAANSVRMTVSRARNKLRDKLKEKEPV